MQRQYGLDALAGRVGTRLKQGEDSGVLVARQSTALAHASYEASRLHERETPLEVDLIKSRKDYVREKIIPHIRFRIAGWADGKRTDVDTDLQRGVRAVEHNLVIDPELIDQEFKALPAALAAVGGDYSKLSADQFPFVRKGKQAYLSSLEQLREVHKRGVVWLAELGPDRIPIAYSHGLLQTPNTSGSKEGDPFFENLDARNMVGAYEKYVRANAANTMAIWRTGVRESVSREELGDLLPFEGDQLELRRLGLGSTLKYLFAVLGKIREIRGMILNVGHVVSTDATAEELSMPNAASTPYNKNFLMDMGYRDFHTALVNALGEDVALMYFKVLGSPKNETAIARLIEDDGPMHRTGWRKVLPQLDAVAREASEQLKADGK